MSGFASERTTLYAINIVLAVIAVSCDLAALVIDASHGVNIAIYMIGFIALLVWGLLCLVYFSVALCVRCCSRRNKFNSTLADMIILSVLFVWGLGNLGYLSGGMSLWVQIASNSIGSWLLLVTNALGWILIVLMLTCILVAATGRGAGSKKHHRAWSKTLYELGENQPVQPAGFVPHAAMPGQQMYIPVQPPNGQTMYQPVVAMGANSQNVYPQPVQPMPPVQPAHTFVVQPSAFAPQHLAPTLSPQRQTVDDKVSEQAFIPTPDSLPAYHTGE